VFAGSFESAARPPAAAISLAATDVPTSADRFGAIDDIRDSTYCRLLMISNFFKKKSAIVVLHLLLLLVKFVVWLHRDLKLHHTPTTTIATPSTTNTIPKQKGENEQQQRQHNNTPRQL
jgi:site-specific recombinase XerC